jgi:hypothetical protein
VGVWAVNRRKCRIGNLHPRVVGRVDGQRKRRIVPGELKYLSIVQLENLGAGGSGLSKQLHPSSRPHPWPAGDSPMQHFSKAIGCATSNESASTKVGVG